MKTGMANLKIIPLLLLLTIAMIIVCTTKSPTGPDSGGAIKISLVEEGIYETDYTGTDLNMIVEFEDSIECSFDTIKIHCTDAHFYLPDESLVGQKILSVVIPLYWISTLKLSIDSSTMLPYDTVFVQVGLTKSNIVTINILNLPPYIDSLCVGDTSYNVFYRIQDLNVFNFYIKDSLVQTDITLRVHARDLDATGYKVAWENEGDDKYFVWNQIQNPAVTATYKAREGNFRDLVMLVVSDNDAQLEVKVNMVQLDGTETRIDSITFNGTYNDTTFKDTSVSRNVMSTIRPDSIAAIRAYPYNSGGTASWTAVKGIITPNLTLDTTGCAITYQCTVSNLSSVLLTDEIQFIDSLRFVYTNSFGDDSTVKTITIYKKPANRNPIIDSILINTIMYDKDYVHIVAAGSTIPLRAYAHDPEGKSVTYTWQGNLIGSLYSLTGDTNSYTAANANYIDTLYLIAADSLGFKDTQMIILPTNQSPIIDSIKIDTAIYKTGFQHVVSAENLITLLAYARDPDGGSVTYTWQPQGQIFSGSLSSTIGNPITYTADTGAYIDSLYLVASDSLSFYDIQLIVMPCNNPPRIDSIRIDNTTKIPVSPTDTVFTYSTTAPDNFNVKVYAHEMDTAIGDVISSYLWNYLDVNQNNAVSTIDSFDYFSDTSSYKDTVSITIKDTYDAVSRKKIIITFTK